MPTFLCGSEAQFVLYFYWESESPIPSPSATTTFYSNSDTKITDGDILETVRAMRDLLLSKQLDIFRMNFVLEKMHLERKVV